MVLRRWIITIVISLSVFAALAGFKFMQISAAIERGKAYPEPSATVQAQLSVATTIRDQTTVLGEVIAPRKLELRNEVSGKISTINFAAGSKVKAGQLLIAIDSSEEQARLNAAKANSELARLTLQRNKKLRKAKRVSAEAYDQAKAQYQTSLADVAALQALIAKKTLIAPFDSNAGLHTLEVGQFLDKNTLLTTLIGLDDFLWVDFKLSQNLAALDGSSQINIQKEQQQAIKASLIASDSMVSSNSRQLAYRAKFTPLKQGAIKVNSMVLVTVASGPEQAAVVVPDLSLSRDQFGQYVFVLNKDGDAYRAERRNVEVGPKQGDKITVMSGINAGELVASVGAFKLREGLKVFIQTGKTIKAENAAGAK